MGRIFFPAIAVISISGLVWFGYQHFLHVQSNEQASYLAANRYFEDENYQSAIENYTAALIADPTNLHARRGLARSYMQTGNYQEALQLYNEVIQAEPGFATSIANRGILHDRMQSYELAIQDYKRALQLEPELAKGPGWLTRFLRNQAERPPSILDRLKYLENELKKPEDQRLLSVPAMDEQQRPYKM